MAYVNGNLALQPKRKPEQRPQFRETKKVVIKRKSLPVQEKLLYMFTILVCVIVAGVVIFRYAQIYQMELQIKQLTKQHEQLTEQVAFLTSEFEKARDPKNIRDLAEKYGYTYPEDDSSLIKVNAATETPVASSKE
ncbi:cell division initiation protein [Paenibacillus lignilyticus]|uniref:Cell division initiation protein n=1 Tax=Paenibacillus lignilyticus TaxID=1172615 RepID=A0ABS5CE38_9BACL|nr:cell division initiation protein [Paenibacillus lignilyticus]MBP3964238.1 cell division initiation protein [Paenibacillus lignilyticus]